MILVVGCWFFLTIFAFEFFLQFWELVHFWKWVLGSLVFYVFSFNDVFLFGFRCGLFFLTISPLSFSFNFGS